MRKEKIYVSTPAKLEVTCTNTTLDKSGIGTGDIVSSHRLNRITVRITDAGGAVVYTNAVYPFGGRAGSYSRQAPVHWISGRQSYRHRVLQRR